MKLLVNVASLAPPLTGIGHYTRSLLFIMLTDPELSAEIDDIKGFDLFRTYSRAELLSLVMGQADSHGGEKKGAEGSGEESIVLQPGAFYHALQWLKPYVKKVPGIRKLKSYLQHRRMAQIMSRVQGYIYWEPNYIQLDYTGPCVATIYDLSHLHHPEYHIESRVKELTLGLPDTLAQAARLVTISQFSAQQIQAELKPHQPVDLVLPWAGEAFFTVTEEDKQALRARYQLPENFLLSVATLEPRKNFVGLLKAYASLPQELRRSYPLILAGAKGWLDDEIHQILKPMQERGEVVYLGYVPQDDMPALFAAASVMAYVSFYEGFGMPVIEAMAAGTAVVTSNCTSMPEVAAGGAVLVDPYDIQDIAAGLKMLLSDVGLRESLEHKGSARAESWSWRASAEALVDVFRKV